eukprot:142558_1
MSGIGDLDPLEVLQEDLKDDNVEVQLDAIRALPTISLALGPHRTATELFACLDKYCFPVEVQAAKSPEAYSNTDSLAAKEEVLCCIASQISPELIEYCGGSRQAAKYMLPLLEKLSMVEETVIRQAAISSLNAVCCKLDIEDVRSAGMGILCKLAEADWFTSRVSASALTPSLYSVLTFEEDRRQILEIHKRLCCDDMPMVKNDAYKNLVELIDNMQSHQLILAYTKPLLENLTSELMENMRQCIVDITLKIAEKIEDEKKQDIVPQFIKAAVEDDSWRVRKHLAEELAKICKYLDNNRVVDAVSPLYIKLLGDSEPQVRKSSILILSQLLSVSHGDAFSKPLINGPIQSLASDSVAEVREALAEQISHIGQYLDSQIAKDKLLPILKKLASDESPQTRLNLCSKLSNVSSILGIDLFESEILPLLNEVTIDQKWRVRNSIVTNIAAIGVQMDKDKFSKSRLRDILIQSLKDPASTVRETAAQQVNMLNSSFGNDWMQKYIFAEMKKIYSQSGNYLHRMVPLKAIQLMATNKSLTNKHIKTQFNDLLHAALKDSISNVRFTACRVVQTVVIKVKLDQDIKNQFGEVLTKIAKTDQDEDVVFFAKQALKVI